MHYLSQYPRGECRGSSKRTGNILKFVKADLKESQEDFHDIYVKQLQNSIRHIKESREMEERFMI